MERQEEKRSVDTLKKILREGKPVTIEVDGEKKDVFWANIGFSSRIYYRAYVSKQVRAAEESGILDRLKGKEEIDTDGEKKAIVLKHSSIISETVDLKLDGNPIFTDKYSVNTGVALFEHEPKGKLEVEYEYYDPDVFEEISNDAMTCVLIFLSVRDIEDHNKKIFKTPGDVGELTVEDAGNIVSTYLEKIKVSEDELKNLPTPLSSGEEEASPNDTEQTHTDQKSGEDTEEEVGSQ